MKKLIVILIFTITSQLLYSQENISSGGGEAVISEKSTCLSDIQRQEINSMLERNTLALQKQGILNSNRLRTDVEVAFDWPLKKADGFTFNSYYGISNFVDHNSGSGIQDFNCGNKSYDGHNGTDIFLWPFTWYMVENDFVEIIAGEGGIIVGKQDGHDDDHCEQFGSWNAVYIQHDDGSVAWYGHMKKYSLTNKSLGEHVAKGEYLGIVASSGYSTGPHLHLEMYDSSNNLIDPFAGNCNDLNSSTWWVNQLDYREPTLNAILTHDEKPVFGCPGDNEFTYFSDTFSPGQSVYFATYFHDQTEGDKADLRIVNSEGTVWKNMNLTATTTYNASWWWWRRDMPVDGPFGTWRFEIDFKGETFAHEFEYLSPVTVKQVDRGMHTVEIHPNPTSGIFEIVGDAISEVKIINSRGVLLENIKLSDRYIDINKLSKGVYFLLMKSKDGVITKRIVKI